MEENNDEPKVIHTYQSDVEAALKRDNVSRTQVFVAQQEKVNQTRTYIQSETKPSEFIFNLRYVFVTIIFLVIVGVGAYYFYNSQKKTETLPVAQVKKEEEQILTYDSSESVKINPEDKRGVLLNFINTSKQKYTSNGVEVLSFDLTSDKFLYIISPGVSGTFVRSLLSNFAFGLTGGGSQTGSARSFIVFKVDSFSVAKGSLLTDEGNLVDQFQDIFNIPNDPNLRFRDRVIENHDARVLVDHDNNVKFLYSFIDSETLVFAENDDTFKIVLGRINSSKR